MSSVEILDRDVVDSLRSPSQNTSGYGRIRELYRIGHESVSVKGEHSNSVTDRVELFPSLVRGLEFDCGPISSVSEIEEHLYFKMIVSMGRVVIPLVLREIEEDSSIWLFSVLREISGENAVKQEHNGIVDEMANDWFTWAREEGIEW